MGNLTIITIFVVMVNILMWFSATAMKDLNQDLANGLCFHLESTIINENIQSTDAGYVLKNNISEQLPSGTGSILPSSSLNFIDVFVNILSWIKRLPGFLLSLITAPAILLACSGLPDIFIIGIDVLWYLITLVIIVEFLKGSG